MKITNHPKRTNFIGFCLILLLSLPIFCSGYVIVPPPLSGGSGNTTIINNTYYVNTTNNVTNNITNYVNSTMNLAGVMFAQNQTNRTLTNQAYTGTYPNGTLQIGTISVSVSESDPIAVPMFANYYTKGTIDSMLLSYLPISSFWSSFNTAIKNDSTILSINNTVNSLGNWSADKGSYNTITADATQDQNLVSTVGNWSADKSSYSTSSTIGTWLSALPNVSNGAITGNLSLAYSAISGNISLVNTNINNNISLVGTWLSWLNNVSLTNIVNMISGNLSLAYSAISGNITQDASVDQATIYANLRNTTNISNYPKNNTAVYFTSLGIGTPTLTNSVTINGTGKEIVSVQSSGTISDATFKLIRGVECTDASTDYFLNDSGGYLYFQQCSSGSPTNRLTIADSTGNIGIGTSTPNQLLQVAGSINATGYISGTNIGQTVTKTLVNGSNGKNCTLIFTSGLLTGGTC